MLAPGAWENTPPWAAGSVTLCQQQTPEEEHTAGGRRNLLLILFLSLSSSYEPLRQLFTPVIVHFYTLRTTLIRLLRNYGHQLAGTPPQRVKNQLSRVPPPSFLIQIIPNSSLCSLSLLRVQVASHGYYHPSGSVFPFHLSVLRFLFNQFYLLNSDKAAVVLLTLTNPDWQIHLFESKSKLLTIGLSCGRPAEV